MHSLLRGSGLALRNGYQQGWQLQEGTRNLQGGNYPTSAGHLSHSRGFRVPPSWAVPSVMLAAASPDLPRGRGTRAGCAASASRSGARSRPAALLGQKVPFSTSFCTHAILQPALSLLPSLPGLRFTSSRAASSSLLAVLGWRLCSPSTIKILEVVLCLARGGEVMCAWNGLWGAWLQLVLSQDHGDHRHRFSHPRFGLLAAAKI